MQRLMVTKVRWYRFDLRRHVPVRSRQHWQFFSTRGAFRPGATCRVRAAKILRVSDANNNEEVRARFRALAFEHHPDIAGGSSERFQEVHEAYRVLSGCASSEASKTNAAPVKSAEDIAVERLAKAADEGNVEEGLQVWAYIMQAEGFVLEYFSVFPVVMRLVAMSEHPRIGFKMIEEAHGKGYLPGEAYSRCWNDLLDAVSLNDDMDLSMEILNEMEFRKLQPKIETVYKVFRYFGGVS